MRYDIKQLENMKTHDLADLLANFVLILRRLPDIPFSQLQDQVPEKPGPDLLSKASERVNGPLLPDWSKE